MKVAEWQQQAKGRMSDMLKSEIKKKIRAVIPSPARHAYQMAQWRFSARNPDKIIERWLSFKGLASQRRSKGVVKYSRFLRAADPTLNLPELKDAKFIGSGWGDWNLNLYRSGTIDGIPVFEKVYLSNSESIRKIKWFHNIVLPELSSKIRTPPIFLQECGDRLTVVYFYFYSLGAPVNSDSLLPIAKALQSDTADFSWSGSDPVIRDFRRDIFYSKHRAELSSILSRNGRNPIHIENIECWLKRAEIPYQFAHGDLSVDNVLSCGTILDFDYCGFYPAGYDCGAALRVSQNIANVMELESIVEKQLSPNCESTQLAIMFFMSVFSSIGASRKTNEFIDENFLLSLWDRILERFYSKSVDYIFFT